MRDSTGFDRASDLLRRHTGDTGRPGEFTLLDREWELLDGVFSPTYTPVTGLFTTWLPFPDGAPSWRSARAPGSPPWSRPRRAAPR